MPIAVSLMAPEAASRYPLFSFSIFGQSTPRRFEIPPRAYYLAQPRLKNRLSRYAEQQGQNANCHKFFFDPSGTITLIDIVVFLYLV
jgi:hypothetical protein